MTSLKHVRPLLSLVPAAGRLLLDLLYPPRCPACQADVAAEGYFCADCFAKLRMITDPMCACCGIPFAVTIEQGASCPDCLATPPNFTKARAVMVYDQISAPLISNLKFRDQWSGLPRHSSMMAASGRDLLAGADAILPVPLHWRRLVRRAFNQSALLAYSISAQTRIPCDTTILYRARYTRPQMRLTRKLRARNVRRAFAVRPNRHAAIAGKTFLLIDDVITTGATVNACARALLTAGAKEVRVLALARTLRE